MASRIFSGAADAPRKYEDCASNGIPTIVGTAVSVLLMSDLSLSGPYSFILSARSCLRWRSLEPGADFDFGNPISLALAYRRRGRNFGTLWKTFERRFTLPELFPVFSSTYIFPIRELQTRPVN